MKHSLLLLFVLLNAAGYSFAKDYRITSPDGNTVVTINAGTDLRWSALYVIFESPLQMISDSPSNYMKEQECTDFIAGIPVVWDDLRVLGGKNITGKSKLSKRK